MDKRISLNVDAELLNEATRLSGAKTPSAAVNRALEEFVQRHRARGILLLAGSGAWEGDLGEMRRER